MQTLRIGSTGTYVKYLQLALTRFGAQTQIDGRFGPVTKNNLQRFQNEYSLLPDGIAGQKTWPILMQYLRGYEFYRIQSGDTLYLLANRFRTTQNRIQAANPSLNPNNLNVGTTIIIPYGFSLVPTNVPVSYFLTKLIYDGMLARYPFLSGQSIGTSTMGNNLYSIQIGTGKSEVFYNGSHHANEWITTTLLLKFIEEYAESYATGTALYNFSAKDLYQTTSLFIVPLENPDGVDLVNETIDKNSVFYTRAKTYGENYPQIPFPSGWKANIDGIDTNLSYPAKWETARKIKFSQGFTSPAPRDYVGAEVLAATESLAIYDFTLEKNFQLTLSYHTQGKVIFWQFLDYLPPKSREIAELFSEVSGYELEETPYASSFAGYKDWFIQNYNRPGFTIEAGSGINPLPIEQFDEIYRDNIGILTNGLSVFIDMP